ncbi:alcohol dehydrogenase, zinc-containing [Fructilactobacillus florum DSM 22689 = JCM 16035]|uniref:Alcohol dehydrogenase, zinc-containing n=3 Tax=Fructilactobacillus florum TaxID=640331 RepID=A0A0R2CKR5_9LACO|nr:alcohol dehydrogenase, zinc-containing [Fructilactobacillus florum DSM 22689 = JCM 16035]
MGGKSLKESFEILKPGGKLITINGIPDFKFGQQHHLGVFKSILFEIASLPLRRLAKKYQVNYCFFIMHPSGKQLETITKLIESGKVKSVIDKVYPFSKVDEAYQLLESKHATGKIVVDMEHLN